MLQTMKPFPRLGSMRVPVIKEQIMEHTCPRRRSRIQMKHFTETVIAISHPKTMFIAVCFPMLRIFFHFQHDRMLRQVLY